jgi:hypothetical protein
LDFFFFFLFTLYSTRLLPPLCRRIQCSFFSVINKLLVSSSGSASTTTTNGHAIYNLAGFTNGRDVIKNGNAAHNKYGEGGAHKYQNGLSKGNNENASQLNGGGKEISLQTI